MLPGERAVVWTAHDGGLAAADALRAAGVDVVAVLDARDGRDGGPAAEVLGTDADADGRLRAVRTTTGTHEVDLLAVSGGLDPDLRLWTHAGGTTRWSDVAAAFLPDAAPPGGRWSVVGSAATGRPGSACFCAHDVADPERVFLDTHRDATLGDVRRALDAGLRSVEHVKRHTTIGTGADQGRSSGVVTAGVVAGLLGEPLGRVGHTGARPPLVPLSFGLLASRHRGVLSDPLRSRRSTTASPPPPWRTSASGTAPTPSRAGARTAPSRPSTRPSCASAAPCGPASG